MTYQPIQVRPTVLTIEREAEHDDTPPMVHLYPRGPAYRLSGVASPQVGDIAHCGWRKQIPGHHQPRGTPPDCVVCAAMRRNA